MAGFILSFGQGFQNYIETIKNNFDYFKKLNLSFDFSDTEFHLSKFKRMYDKEDKNFFESNEIVMCCIGSLLYDEFGFDDSIYELGKSLCGGSTIQKLIDKVDGNFNLIIIYKKEKRINIVTDFGGVINSYIFKKDNMFFISTSMLALAKSLKISLNIESILLFLRSGMFFDDMTYFNEINALKPASIYEYDFNHKKLTCSNYWEVPKEVNNNITFNAATNKITKSLLRIIDVIPIEDSIFDFTGGYDSRFVIALASRKESVRKNINSFFFGPPDSREAQIVEKNCLNTGIKYNNYVPDTDWPKKFYDYILESNNLCDGLENSCAYASILLNGKLKRKNFKFSIHGTFGELFRQRTWEFEFGSRGKQKPAKFDRLIKYRNLAGEFNQNIFSKKYRSSIQHVTDKILYIYKNTSKIFNKKTPNTLQLDYIYFSQRARRWGGRTITTSNQIIKTICPLWFRKPLEISFALDPRYKMRCKLMRYIVEKENPIFAKEKMITGTPFVVMNFKNIYLFFPGAIFFLRKFIRKLYQILFKKTIWAGLTTPDYNTSEWYRAALNDQRCQDLLNWHNMRSSFFYNQIQFDEFKNNAKEGSFHHYDQLGRIITVELTLCAVNIEDKKGF